MLKFVKKLWRSNGGQLLFKTLISSSLSHAKIVEDGIWTNHDYSTDEFAAINGKARFVTDIS